MFFQIAIVYKKLQDKKTLPCLILGANSSDKNFYLFAFKVCILEITFLLIVLNQSYSEHFSLVFSTNWYYQL